MARLIYNDFQHTYRVYADHLDRKAVYTGPDVLFVTHELTLTGAPLMVLYAARAVREGGGFPIVVAPQDGPLREAFTQAGIAVIVDASIRSNHFLFERFARNFDLAVVSTIALADVVRQLSAIPILRTVWWLHEARALAEAGRDFRGVEWNRVRAVCVSEYARSFLPPGIHADVLYGGIPDEAGVQEAVRSLSVPLVFVLPGTIEPRKGQDVLVDAVAMLPPDIRRKSRFILAGMLWDLHRDYWHRICVKMSGMPEVEYVGALDHRSTLDLIDRADVLVCASRDESMSMVVMEACMLSRPSILSDRVGAAELLNSDCFLTFASGNATALAEQLTAMHERRDELARMGAAARRHFEAKMTIESFALRLHALIAEEIARDASREPKLGAAA